MTASDEGLESDIKKNSEHKVKSKGNSMKPNGLQLPGPPSSSLPNSKEAEYQR